METPTGNLNSEGALASLPAGDTDQRYFFSSFRDGGGLHVDPQPSRGGRFRATITGGASAMTGFGISNITQINPTTWEFDCDWIGNKWLTFTPTAFPIKVSIIRTDLLSAHAGGAIFDPNWLNRVPNSGCVRFMDWALTNSSPIVNVADYPVEASQQWRRAPLSVMVALCNAKNLDPWICIPHAASDAFITNWATYLRDNLNTARKIRVEYSNEIWNTALFSVGLYLKGLAESVWGVANGYDGSWMDYGGKKFAQTMQIFNSVFAGQTNRLIGVIGTQIVDPTLSQRALDATVWRTNEPGAYVAPHTLAKECAVGDYIGWQNPIPDANEIKTALDISHAAAVAKIKEKVVAAGIANRSFHITGRNMAIPRRLRLTSYEWGNHFDLVRVSASNLYSGGNPVPGALEAFIEALYSQEVADVYTDYLTNWKNVGGTLKCHYFHIGRANRFGVWGMRTHVEHNPPIATAIEGFAAANPRWWNQS